METFAVDNHEMRRKGLGGSDAGAVIGVNPWTSRTELWQEKTGRVPPPDLSGKEAVMWGNLLEGPIAEEYARRTGVKVRKVSRVFRHHEHKFMFGHIDRKIQGRDALVEVKTVGLRQAGMWSEDEIPAHYAAQVDHYLACTGWEFCDVAALIGGQELRIHRIQRDEAKIMRLVKSECEFWECVLSDTPPTPTTTGETGLLHPEAESRKESVADEYTLEQIARAAALNADINSLKTRLDRTKARIQAAMEDAEILRDETGVKLCTWVNAHRKSFDSGRFKKTHPEMYDEFSTTTRFRTFRIA